MLCECFIEIGVVCRGVTLSVPGDAPPAMPWCCSTLVRLLVTSQKKCDDIGLRVCLGIVVPEQF